MPKKVLITGASGGFGKLTVETLLQNGHAVAATMRGVEGKNQEIAEQLDEEGAKVVELDVTSDDSVNAGVAQAIAQLGGLDVVVNNAGVGTLGMIEHFTSEDYKKLFDVNVVGVQRVNRAALPHFRAQGSGLLLHISSLLGRVCMPFYGPYNATKWALEAMSDNYRVELSGFGVDSCLVEPGGFPTTFFENLMQPSDDSRNESYGEFMQAPEAMFKGFADALANIPEQQPQKVADAVLKLVETPAGSRPARTTVDYTGMGALVEPANAQLKDIMQNLYGAYHIDHMLNVKPPEA